MGLALYTYFRSSASYRVRIALEWKGVPVEHRFINLRKEGGGEQREAAYAALNPQRLVPLLVDGDFLLNQSLAILEYIEELHPQPALLPDTARGRARVRALAQMICCEVQPLQNTRVQRYLAARARPARERRARMGAPLHRGRPRRVRSAARRVRQAGPYCFGSAPTLADVCLVPQLYNARRAGCALERYPRIVAIVDACNALPAFQAAAPERQADCALP